ncbi:MAG: hypothetical protein ACREOC_03360 [Gemmatimonadales bacterium]
MTKRRRAKKHREPPKTPSGTAPEPRLPPVDKSVGETRDNLAQRAKWFERRSGRRD